ncbi:hypothetical protein EMCRGX_G012251 [Ephydatia muelleri]
MVILQLVVFLLIYGIKGKIQLCTVITHSHLIRANYFLHTFNWKRFAKIIGMKRPVKCAILHSSTLVMEKSSSPNTVVTYTCTITNGTAAGLTDWALPNGTCPTNAFPNKIRLSQFVSGQCTAQVTSTCGPYAAYSIQSSDPTYCLSSILNVTITAAMNGSTVTCYNTNYLNSSITGVVFSATINIVATPPTSGPPITGSTNDTAGWIARVIIGSIAFIIIVVGIVVVSITKRKWAPLFKRGLLDHGEVPLVVVKKASESTEAAPQQITACGRVWLISLCGVTMDTDPFFKNATPFCLVQLPTEEMVLQQMRLLKTTLRNLLTHVQVNSGTYKREHSDSEEKEAGFLSTPDLAVGKASQSNLVTGSN